ncbi:MAG: TIGR04282 family arsenosugar biosynthesis glycosyltransferase [Candidatus Thorarchaeota archaeon]
MGKKLIILGVTMEKSPKQHQPGIFILMKYPELGKVKSRLARSIGDEPAANLYRAFIEDTLATVQSLGIAYHIAVYPPESEPMFSEWLGPSHKFFHQEGKNLGERLQNGFKTMFEIGYRQVIALASDSPDLPCEILDNAISSFHTSNVVVGPATDGGYYLIGFSSEHFIPDAFVDVTWGTEYVFEETMAQVESVTRDVHVLSEWVDIDTKNQLRQFYEKYKMQSSHNLKSMKYLHSHPEVLQRILS